MAVLFSLSAHVDTKFDSPVGSAGTRVNGDKAVMLRGQLSF